MEGDRLKGNLRLLLLATIASGPAHGYVIVRRLRERSEGAFDLPEGTVYPALHGLEKSGCLRAEWVSAEGRQRKVYHLTAAGARQLDAELESWDRFARAIGKATGRTAWET